MIETKAFQGYKSSYGYANDDKPVVPLMEGSFGLKTDLDAPAFHFTYTCSPDGEDMEVAGVRLGSATVFTESQLLDCMDAVLQVCGSSLNEFLREMRNEKTEVEQ